MEAPDDSDTLTFKPRQMFVGIAYHLLEDAWAQSVNIDSINAELGRIPKRKKGSVISRTIWRQLTNRMRLIWLLKRVGCEVVIDGESGEAFVYSKKAPAETEDNADRKNRQDV